MAEGPAGDRPRGEDPDDRRDDDDAAAHAVADGDRDQERHREEDGHARLRVGEVQAGEDERDDRRRDEEADLPEPEEHEQHADREHQVAAVDARVLEHRGHPEERRVGVRDPQVVREEEGAGLLLPEADPREGDGEPDER